MTDNPYAKNYQAARRYQLLLQSQRIEKLKAARNMPEKVLRQEEQRLADMQALGASCAVPPRRDPIGA